MSEGWKWWAGSDEEICTIGPCETREQAIDEALQDGIGEEKIDGIWHACFFVCEARQDPLFVADWIRAEELIDRADEEVSESDRTAAESDEGPYFECSPEQASDLAARVKAACNEWQTAHGLTFKANTFSAQRKSEALQIKLPAEQTPT